MKKKFLLITLLFTVSLIISIEILFNYRFGNPNQICFKNNCFYVELAETAEERSRGLMFRESLDLDKGMLFVFEKEGNYPFWMKNTLILLDIIWINESKEVVFISKDSQPCKEEYPCLPINSDKIAKYVLELNGGIAEKIGLSVGDKITLKK